MNLSWYGLNCFKFVFKTPQGEITLITDPFDFKKIAPKTPRFLKTNIGLISDPSITNKEIFAPLDQEEVFLIEAPGEYEKKDIFIRGLVVGSPPQIIYFIEGEDLKVLYCAFLKSIPQEEDFAEIENIDLLILPVGDREALKAKEAAKLVHFFEPRLVVPSYYKLDGFKTNLEPVDDFLKEMGVKTPETLPKLKLNRKDLPQEEIKVVLLNPEI